MTRVYDRVVSALIDMKKRSALEDEVDNTVDLLIKAVKDNKDIIPVTNDLTYKIGDLMCEQFEYGMRCGIQLVIQALNPVEVSQ